MLGNDYEQQEAKSEAEDMALIRLIDEICENFASIKIELALEQAVRRNIERRS